MKTSGPRGIVRGLLATATLLSLATGCASDRAPRRWTDDPDQARVVQRPVFPTRPGGVKPLFVGGYAGAAY